MHVEATVEAGVGMLRQDHMLFRAAMAGDHFTKQKPR
jgi:hypothetical protein